MKKVVLSIRMPEAMADGFKVEAARLGIGVSELLLRRLAGTAMPTHDQGAAGEYHNSPPVVEAKGGPKLTARYMFDQYKAEKDIPPAFAIAHSKGVIPLSWFTVRHGFPDASHIDAFDEFISIDEPSDFGLMEPAWEFVEE